MKDAKIVSGTLSTVSWMLKEEDGASIGLRQLTRISISVHTLINLYRRGGMMREKSRDTTLERLIAQNLEPEVQLVHRSYMDFSAGFITGVVVGMCLLALII